jgi:natural product precursor
MSNFTEHALSRMEMKNVTGGITCTYSCGYLTGGSSPMYFTHSTNIGNNCSWWQFVAPGPCY